MCPLSDDALLDWVLFPKEADPAIARHLEGCASCRTRSQALLREQDGLRGQFQALAKGADAVPTIGVPVVDTVWRRLGIAALLLFGVGVGVFLARGAAHPTPHRSPVARHRRTPMAPIQTDLGLMAQKIAAARDTLGRAEDHKSTSEYLNLLAQEEDLYVDGMAQYLGERSPLAQDQEGALRRVITGFYSRISNREDAVEASRTFRDQVRALLNDEQYVAFEEFTSQGMEWQWKTAIALLMDDLSLELDLRFSEAERVRRALESNYPRLNLPILCSEHCPTDPLVDNAVLSGAVRNSLDSTYFRKFEQYLGHAKVARERALKITRQRRLPD